MPFVPGEPIDAVREKVVSALSLHFANDRLTLEELEHRLGLVYSARSPGELTQLLADLPASTSVTAAPTIAVVPPDEVPARRTLFAVMSEVKRKGAWTVPRELQVVALMGDARIDLRTATFASGVTTINAYGLMGDITIIVPPEVGIDADGSSLMGTVDSVSQRGAAPGYPTLRIEGFGLMADIHVKVRAPGEK